MKTVMVPAALADIETKRLAALHEYDILDTPPEAAFDRLARAAADLCETQMALISLVDHDRQWFKSRIGIAIDETSRAVAFCAQAINQDEVFIVPDATLDARFAANPLVTGELGVRFYAGAPLTTSDGYRVGTLCVFDRRERRDGLSDNQASVLSALAAQVVSELELRRALTQLRQLLHQDTLTGLPNRLLFQSRFEAALALRRDVDQRGAIVLLDLDHFKHVNDLYGHLAGDNLLKIVAERLAGFIGPDETVARLGGDEFTLILPDCGDDAAIEVRLSRLLRILAAPIELNGREVDIRASAGVACFPDHGGDPVSLLKYADIAMYRAKAAGRGAIRMYRPSHSMVLERRQETLGAVRRALRDKRVFPYYQGQTSLETGMIVGAEALVRLLNDDGILQLPGQFEDALDDAELATSIGACMLHQVAADLRRWIDAGITIGHVAINASAIELRGDYAAMVLATFAKAGVSPTLLQVEVTEGVFLGRGASRVEATLRRLDDAGVRIALDDFGTGFASLTHLKKFPISVIKIDQGFVSGLDTNPNDDAIVQAVVGLAHNLGMEVVAEGVETKAQAKQLRKLGCTLAQGFYLKGLCPAMILPQRSKRRRLECAMFATRCKIDHSGFAF